VDENIQSNLATLQTESFQTFSLFSSLKTDSLMFLNSRIIKMSWHYVSDLKTLQSLNRQVVSVENQKILLIWHEDQIYAVQSQCPHLKLPLAKAEINQKNEIVCPFHKSAFDLCTGDVKCWSPWPAMLSGVLGKVSKPKNLNIYPVKIEDDRIMVEIA
jgi:nitrite reductase/ring-hydroxylating ferredoxin subunit